MKNTMQDKKLISESKNNNLTKINEKTSFISDYKALSDNKKKRKNDKNKVEKMANNSKNIDNDAKIENKKLIAEAYKTDLIIYIKVLLDAYKSLPSIMNIIDRLIEKRASSVIPASYIYGNNYLTTYSEINKVIDMSERKDKLLNLYVIIENMLNSLNERERKIAVLKFVQKCNTEDIAKDFGTTDRTIYRTANRIVEKLAIFLLKQNWNSEFIRFQIGSNEPWLIELFKKKKAEEKINKQRGEKTVGKHQSKSSSSITS